MVSVTKYRTLTAKETEVLDLLARGYLVKEAAAVFGVSTQAVDHRIERVRRKLGVPAHTGTSAILPILALNPENLVPYENHRNPPTDLTERQREVLHYITSGLKQAEVAKVLQISQDCVESHMEAVRSIMRRKLGRKKITIVELTHYAIAHRVTPLQFTERGIYDHRKCQLQPFRQQAAG